MALPMMFYIIEAWLFIFMFGAIVWYGDFECLRCCWSNVVLVDDGDLQNSSDDELSD